MTIIFGNQSQDNAAVSFKTFAVFASFPSGLSSTVCVCISLYFWCVDTVEEKTLERPSLHLLRGSLFLTNRRRWPRFSNQKSVAGDGTEQMLETMLSMEGRVFD